jgi:hypothetical protein
MRVESLARFDEPSAGDLKQVLLILTAMQEPAGERFG